MANRYALLIGCTVAFLSAVGYTDSHYTSTDHSTQEVLVVFNDTDFSSLTPVGVIMYSVAAEVPEGVIIETPELGMKKPIDALVVGKPSKVCINRIRPPPGLGSEKSVITR